MTHKAQLVRRRTLMPELTREQGETFHDDFEGETIHSFWQVIVENPQGVSIRLDRSQPRSGEQSLHLRVERNLSVGNMAEIRHDYPPGTQGEWSVYYHENGNLDPDLYTSGHSSSFYVRNKSTSLGIFKDSRLLPGYYLGAVPKAPPIRTDIPVTKGWHHFLIRVDNYGTKVFIDGVQQVVYNDLLRDVTRVGIGYGGHHAAPDDYWDDFQAVLFRPTVFTEIGEYTAGFVGDCRAMAWADLDGDGDQDVYAAMLVDGPINVLALNIGPVQYFKHLGPEAGLDLRERVSGAAWNDFDQDGDFDLYVTSDRPGGSLYRNEGNLQFKRINEKVQLVYEGRGVRPLWCDFDGDNWPDLYISGVNLLYRNLNGVRFVDVTQESGLPSGPAGAFAACADTDRDGAPDLYLAGVGVKADLYRNLGDGHFVPVGRQVGLPLPLESYGATWGDFDADGLSDLYLLTKQGSRLFRNMGNGTFSEVTEPTGVAQPEQGIAAAWGDYDQDGFSDLYVLGDSEGQYEWLYHNNGDGTFTEVHHEANVQALNSARRGRDAIWIDHDGDGDLDLYVATDAGSNVLYRNNHQGGEATLPKKAEDAHASNK